jgi:hypothetical protein
MDKETVQGEDPVSKAVKRKSALSPRVWVFLLSGIVVCLIIVGVLHVRKSFAGLVQSNCDELSILACELMCETGPDFTRPIDPDDLTIVLEGYAEYIEEKHLSVLLRIFSSYNPEKVFSDIKKTLVNVEGSQEKAANDIWQTGEEVMLFRLKTPTKFLPRGRTPYEYNKAAELLLPLAEAAIKNSKEASDQFNNTPTMKNGVYSCERNRLTMLLLFPLRTSYDKPEIASLFDSFRDVVNECRDRKIDVAGEPPYDDPRKEFLREIIGRSEKRRLDILDAIIEKRDMQEVIKYMWNAIEISYHDRERLLQLCEKIRTTDYSEPITPSFACL